MLRPKPSSRCRGPCSGGVLLCAATWIVAGLFWPLVPGVEGRRAWGASPPAGKEPSAETRIAGLLGALRQMDRNGNGYVDPGEPLLRDRAMVDRLARLARLDPRRPVSIRAIEAALRSSYVAGRSGSSSDPKRPAGGTSSPWRSPPLSGRQDGETGVRGFGSEEVPGFGHQGQGPKVKVEWYDVEKANERFRRYDANKDRYLDREEIGRGRWHDDLLKHDADGDGRISVEELARRYALQRRAEAEPSRGPSPQPSPRQSSTNSNNSGRPPEAKTPEERRREEEQRHREEEERRRREHEQRRQRYSQIDRQYWYLAATLFSRYDSDRNGHLDGRELRGTGIKASSGDGNGDGRLSREELAFWLSQETGRQRNRRAGRPPDWFAERDANRDGQVTMAEFAEDWTEEKVAEFERHDANGDGVIVPEECAGSAGLPQGSFSNHDFQIIPQGGAITSEIRVEGAREIGDLDVQIAITHTRDEFLDAYLSGPDGRTVELFSGVGGEDDHFDNTVFDDEASRSIVQGRPPFRGRYQTGAAAKGQPGLKQFYGQSAAGTWKLTIRASRSDRSGALHGWALVLKRAED